jgi:hypothetical protein
MNDQRSQLPHWMDALQAGAGRDARAPQHEVSFAGHDPVYPTCFRAGEAAAAALGAAASSAADLWCLRGGAPQQIRIDVRAAAASLLSSGYQRVSGVAFERGSLATTALYRGRDGRWIHLHGGFRSREGTLALLGCADDADAIARTVATWDAQALEDALAERGCCGVRLRSADEWRQQPQGIALGNVPPIEIFKIGDAPPVPLPRLRAAESGARPLSGVRVLDLTRVLAGPTCARTMAEHGADVLHIRGPHLPFVEPFVIDTNPGKRSSISIWIAMKMPSGFVRWLAKLTCSRRATVSELSRGVALVLRLSPRCGPGSLLCRSTVTATRVRGRGVPDGSSWRRRRAAWRSSIQAPNIRRSWARR